MGEKMLVDTNVVSFLFSGQSEAQLYQDVILGKQLYISFITEAELLLWNRRAKWGQKRIKNLQDYLSAFGRVYVSPEVVQHFVNIYELTRGQPIPYPDMWIAACALAYDMTLITHDEDFRRIPGLTVIQRKVMPSNHNAE